MFFKIHDDKVFLDHELGILRENKVLNIKNRARLGGPKIFGAYVLDHAGAFVIIKPYF